MSDLYDDENGDDAEDLNEDDSASDGESTSSSDSSKSTDKRIRDLQSAKDKETAEKNKLQKRLEALEVAMRGTDAEASKPPKGGESFIDDSILDMARMFALQQNPKLNDYGVGVSDLAGSTPAEIAANAAALVTQFSKVETRIRNKVLADNGLSPDLSDSPPPPKRDFSKLNKEDFDKLVNDAMQGRV